LFYEESLYRLTKADSTGVLTTTFQYAYDPVGNRTTQTRTVTSTQVTAYQYDAADRLTNAGGVNYTWDDNGNLVNDGNSLYRYDQANRLISITLGSTTSLFNYNGDGARLRQVIAGVPTTYTQDLAVPLPVVLQSKTGVNAMQYVYALGTRPLAQYGSSWEYLLADALGSVRQIVAANGNVTLAESYEPYGSVLTSTGVASSIFAYAGEQIDTSGLIYLRARYMQPTLGIFLARDPWSGDVMRPSSMNGWNYTEGNPINAVDPSGHFICFAGPPGFIFCIVGGIMLLLTSGCDSPGPPPDSCPALPDNLQPGALRNMNRYEALDRLEIHFKIDLPGGFYFDYGPTDTWDAGGETYWFDDPKGRWGKVRLSEAVFEAYNYNAYDIADAMVHEAVHAWQEYSLEKYAEGGALSQYPNFKSENPYYRTLAWAEEYRGSLELQAEEYVEAHYPQPLCLSEEAFDNISTNKSRHTSKTIPGLDLDRVPLLGRPLP
jgi:RHS repeat-associated protein